MTVKKVSRSISPSASRTGNRPTKPARHKQHTISACSIRLESCLGSPRTLKLYASIRLHFVKVIFFYLYSGDRVLWEGKPTGSQAETSSVLPSSPGRSRRRDNRAGQTTAAAKETICAEKEKVCHQIAFSASRLFLSFQRRPCPLDPRHCRRRRDDRSCPVQTKMKLGNTLEKMLSAAMRRVRVATRTTAAQHRGLRTVARRGGGASAQLRR